MNFSRYAVYFTLPDGPLDQFCAAWLGWNAKTAERLDPPMVDDLPMPPHDITATPRKYGFHGTIKPPFRLAEAQSFDALRDAVSDLCASAAPVALDGFELARLGGFLALVPDGDATGLANLAARVVQELDDFRAPLNEAELAKRRNRPLTPAQEAYLDAWGYPYVLEEFRFHMTLSGSLDIQQAEEVRAALMKPLAPLLPRPVQIDALTLCGEDTNGMFHELHRYTLTG